MTPLEKIIQYILINQLSSFTVKEVKTDLQFNDATLMNNLNRLIELKIISPFGLKKGIYIVNNKRFEYSDYLYLSQRIEPNSIIGGETSLAYYGVLKKKPYSNMGYLKSGSVKEYRYGDFTYIFNVLSEKLYFLGSKKQYNLIMYEPEKALLDLFYLENIKGKKYDDYGIFYSQLDIKKLLSYSIYYPKSIQKTILRRLKEEFNKDFFIPEFNNFEDFGEFTF